MVPPSLVAKRTTTTNPPAKYVAYTVPPSAQRFAVPASGGNRGFSIIGGYRSSGKAFGPPPTSRTVLAYQKTEDGGLIVSDRVSVPQGYGGCCSKYAEGSRGCPGPIGLNDASVIKRATMTTSGLLASRVYHPTGVFNNSCQARCRATSVDYETACKEFRLCNRPCGPEPMTAQEGVTAVQNRALVCNHVDDVRRPHESSGRCCMSCGPGCCKTNKDCVQTFGAGSSSERTRMLRACAARGGAQPR